MGTKHYYDSSYSSKFMSAQDMKIKELITACDVAIKATANSSSKEINTAMVMINKSKKERLIFKALLADSIEELGLIKY